MRTDFVVAVAVAVVAGYDLLVVVSGTTATAEVVSCSKSW